MLARREITLTKSLGQNFLHDGNQLLRIAEFGELARNDRVLEIGPGLGPLTEVLLDRAGHVLAIEKDQRLVKCLEEHFTTPIKEGRLALVWADALEYVQNRDWSRWKLLANLPYSVASPILVELARTVHGPERLVATLQLEVAQRLMAAPASSDYGLLSVLVQAKYQPEGAFKIPSSCFFPEPDVDSACVRLMRKPAPALTASEEPVFERVVKRGFSQRRKMMLKLLRADWPEDALLAGFQQACIATTERAEKVSVDQFIKLTRCLHAAGKAGEELFDVVNERDEVIGTNSRSEVHRLGLMHRAVHILFFNEQSEIYLQKRSIYKDRNPGVWDSSSSGHVDAGEDYLQAAMREIGEELGITPSAPLEPLFKLPGRVETDHEHVSVYRARHNGPFKPDPLEIERGEWFTPHQVTAWMADRPGEFSPTFRTIWKRIHEA